jgi:hypothetical protein
MKNRSEAVKVFCSYPAVLRDSLVNLMKIQFFFIFSDFVLLHRYIKNPSPNPPAHLRSTLEK